MMIKLYFKQAWQLLKQNPLFSLINVMGIALSIAVITMLVVIMQSWVANLEPEVNRSRTLYVKWAGIQKKTNDENCGNGYLSLKTINACFTPLTTPEAISVVSPLQIQLIALPGGMKATRCHTLFTDGQFWKLFHFKTLEGRLYTQADLNAGIQKIVLNQTTAKRIFGSSESAVGKQLVLNYRLFTVCAVVADVSPLATDAYADVWTPYTTGQIKENDWAENISGNYKVFLLARSSADFTKIRQELSKRVDAYNGSLQEYQLNLRSQPDTKLVEFGRFGPGDPDTVSLILTFVLAIVMLLAVPAVNISGLTMGRIYQRMAEMGVRRAYGASRANIMLQVLTENLFLSLLGGMLGVAFSYIGLYLCKDWALSSTAYFGLHIKPELTIFLFLNPWTIFAIFLFCALINLLSAGIPAWRSASVDIVRAIENK